MIVNNNKERLAQKILIRKEIDQRFQTKLFTLEKLIVEEDGLWTDEEHLSVPVDNVTHMVNLIHLCMLPQMNV